jgi:hypothetical protein
MSTITSAFIAGTFPSGEVAKRQSSRAREFFD